MHTMPAALDEIGASDGFDDFRVSSPREVGLLLKQLVDGSVLLNLSADDGPVFTSVIWTMDTARSTISFNADADDPAVQPLLGQRVVVVGYLDNVKVQFEVKNLALVRGAKACVLSCPFPREMLRFQRRNSFRVRPVAKSGPTARLSHPDMPGVEFDLRIVNLSTGGCALFLPLDVPMMNIGIHLRTVRVQLDAETGIHVDLCLRHATPLKGEGGGMHLGFSFVRPGGETLRTLQRFIDSTQKRSKLMALN